MLNRNHLHLSSVSMYIKPGNSFVSFTKKNDTIDLLTDILIIILMGMITLILVSFLIGPDPDEKKKQIKYIIKNNDDKNK